MSTLHVQGEYMGKQFIALFISSGGKSGSGS